MAPARIAYGGIELDAEQWKVRCNGQPVSLSPNEFRLLQLLLTRAEQPVSREEIVRELGWRVTDRHGVKSRVYTLRKALLGASRHDVIKSLRGKGYMLSARHASPQP